MKTNQIKHQQDIRCKGVDKKQFFPPFVTTSQFSFPFFFFLRQLQILEIKKLKSIIR